MRLRSAAPPTLLLRAHVVWSWAREGGGAACARSGRGAGAHTASRVRLRVGPVRGGEATRLRGCIGDVEARRGRSRVAAARSAAPQPAPALPPRCTRAAEAWTAHAAMRRGIWLINIWDVSRSTEGARARGAGRAGRRRGESVCASCMLPCLLLYGCSDVYRIILARKNTRVSLEGLSGACGAGPPMCGCATWCRRVVPGSALAKKVPGTALAKKDEGKQSVTSLRSSVLCQLSLCPPRLHARAPRARAGGTAPVPHM